MKRTLFLFFVLVSSLTFGQEQNVTFTITPGSFDEDEMITITVTGLNRSTWSLTADDVNDPLSGVYLWMWRVDGSGQQDSPTNGQWTDSDESQRMTYNAGLDEYTFQLTPDTFFGTTGITQIGMLVKANDGSDTGSGERKSQDNLVPVGRVIVDITSPAGDAAVVASGDDVTINATISTGGSVTVMGSIEVFLNDVSQGTSTCGFPNCQFILNNVTVGGEVRVVGTPPSSMDMGEASFDLIVAPANNEEAIPAGVVDGINYDDTDDTVATLVVTAPGKDYVFVAGSFNNYTPGASVMKKDPTSDKFWIELTGLTPGNVETYQYWVYDETPVADSPTLVKTADPFSTLVLSPFDDPFIPSSSYPNIPTYPTGQEREVTVLQTGQTPYNWQVNNFTKPKKEDLIIYEVLVRDFDANRNYQDLIDRMDYFVDLNVNAIELMPVMEFEGNESWGYNTSFHMALDKYYGTPDKFKEFVDTCHQNGIAVILDLALNHAFGRNPLVRMWMDDPDGDGWGEPSSDSPYFNEVPQHDFNVGSDFNHQQPLTQEYTRRVVQHWIEEYRIDGIRWDLTKGFTQNCGPDDTNDTFGCTNGYVQDRIDVLRTYADYSWSLDPDHFVIFEHLGTSAEEQQWADYRVGEGKGIMMWGKMTDPYNELSKGFNGSTGNLNGMGHDSRGFADKRLVGYAESHDEERLMYRNLTEGNSSQSSHDVTDLNTAISRMSAVGAVSLTIPGPKMIWHFGELGMENSIFTCPNGSVNDPSGNDGDCKLDTKPQPQWANNWLSDPVRRQVYDDWARLNELKINEDVFEGDYSISPEGNNNYLQRIYIFDTSIPTTELRNVVVLANFDVVTQSIAGGFPFTGTWYELMDDTGNTSINVTNTNVRISIPPGEFRIYGNQPSQALSNEEFLLDEVSLHPNPTSSGFYLNLDNINYLALYDITGKKVKEFGEVVSRGNSYDVSELRPGVYFVKGFNEDGRTFTKKLLKY